MGFRATIRGINETNYFEVCPSHLNADIWYPATITGQRADGFFEVVAQQIDARGCLRTVTYPAVERADLREASSKRPLAVPECSLMLHVPQHDPLKAVLSVDGEPLTHHFGRPSPSPCGLLTTAKPKINLQVSRDRKAVTANVGHGALSHLVSGDVCSVNSKVERLSHSWTVRCGPFAEHTIKIVKNYTLGKIVTLTLDDKVFVESSAADIGCHGSEWQCNFQLVGEHVLDFEVFKTNRDGFALEETDHVVEKRKYVHKCSVIVPNDRDLSTAQLFVNGSNFRELRVMSESVREEPSLCMDPMVMTQSYGITVPYKVDHSAPSGIVCLTNQVLAQAETGKKAAAGFFAWCCQSSAAQEVVETVDLQDERLSTKAQL